MAMNLMFKIKMLLEFWKVISGDLRLLSSKESRELESRLAEFCKVKYALAVASGTDALVLALKALAIGPGDEVIVPALSAFSSAGAVAWVNALPVFVDIELGGLNIDVGKIERAITSKTKAIIAVHLNGQMADMARIRQIADNKSIKVIEDAAQAIGAKYNGYAPAHYGDVACFSFNPAKIFSGFADGGAVLTNDQALAEKISLMRTYGAHPQKMHQEHFQVGVASRISPFHAAILNLKFSELEIAIAACRKNYFLYQELLSGIGDLEFLTFPSSDHFINGHRFFLATGEREQLYKFLSEQDRGRQVRKDFTVPLPYFDALNFGRYKPSDFPIAEQTAARGIFLPTHPRITGREVKEISNLIRQFFLAC